MNMQRKPDRSRFWASFTVRDYVFAAVTAALIHVIGFAAVSLVLHIPIPGIRSIVSAPLSALVLTIGVARIGKPLALALTMGMACVVYLLISPIIPAFVLTSTILTELLNIVVFRGYRTPISRQVSITFFYTVMTPIATLFGAFLLGGEYARFMKSPMILVGSTALVLVLCVVSTRLGEKIVKELRRAGKLGEDMVRDD